MEGREGAMGHMCGLPLHSPLLREADNQSRVAPEFKSSPASALIQVEARPAEKRGGRNVTWLAKESCICTSSARGLRRVACSVLTASLWNVFAPPHVHKGAPDGSE